MNKPEVINVYSTNFLGALDCVRLSDYEALQAEYKKMVEALEAAQKEAIYGLNHARNGAQAAAALGRVSAIVGAALAAHRKQGGES